MVEKRQKIGRTNVLIFVKPSQRTSELSQAYKIRMKKERLETNSYYLGLVQNLYAGMNGCFLAHMQFFYQLLLAKQNFYEFEECFQFLCDKEIENCKILGKCLTKMGGDPQFFSSSRKFLNAKSVCYEKMIDKIFLADIEFLEVNIIELKSSILKIENENLREELRAVLINKKESLKILKQNFFKNKMLT